VIRAVALATLLATVLAPAREARAHEVLHDVDRGRAVAVRTYYADGEALAYAAYEVFSPADPRVPHQKGRTDRAGWLAFVPDAPGAWRVKVVDGSGHGVDAAIEIAASGATGSGARPSAVSAWFVLRPLVGVALIAAIFAALFVLSRRRRGSP
jgi:nickel transport protein